MHESDEAFQSQVPGSLTLNLSEFSIQGRILECCLPAQRGAPEFQRPKISSLRDHPTPFLSVLRPGRKECHHRTLLTGHLRQGAHFGHFPRESNQFTLKSVAEQGPYNVHTRPINLVDCNNRVQVLFLDQV